MTSMHWRHDEDTLIGALGMRLLDSDDNNQVYKACMKVDNRTCQNYGILNGGATIALAETLAGFASYKNCEPNKVPCGMQVNANHLNMAPFGATVTAVATPVKLGRTIHVWTVNVTDDNGTLISQITVTNMIIQKKIY